MKKLTLLIVDDSLVVGRRLRNLMNDSGNVSIVGHARTYGEAILILEMMKPEVVLLDISMPGRNGLELLLEIKLKYKGTKVIMLSNHSDVYYRNLCQEMGAEDFLDKSYEFEKIPDRLNAYA